MCWCGGRCASRCASCRPARAGKLERCRPVAARHRRRRCGRPTMLWCERPPAGLPGPRQGHLFVTALLSRPARALRDEMPGRCPLPTAGCGRQAPPTGPRWPTADMYIPVFRPRSSGLRRTAARRLPATNTGRRPNPAGRAAPKRSAGRPSFLRLHHHEAAVRGLRHPASCGCSRPSGSGAYNCCQAAAKTSTQRAVIARAGVGAGVNPSLRESRTSADALRATAPVAPTLSSAVSCSSAPGFTSWTKIASSRICSLE